MLKDFFQTDRACGFFFTAHLNQINFTAKEVPQCWAACKISQASSDEMVLADGGPVRLNESNTRPDSNGTRRAPKFAQQEPSDRNHVPAL